MYYGTSLNKNISTLEGSSRFLFITRVKSNPLWHISGVQTGVEILSNVEKYQLHASHWSKYMINNSSQFSSSLQLNDKPLAVVAVGAIPTYTGIIIIGGVFRRIRLLNTYRSGLPQVGTDGLHKFTQLANTYCRTVDHSSNRTSNTLLAENIPTSSTQKTYRNP